MTDVDVEFLNSTMDDMTASSVELEDQLSSLKESMDIFFLCVISFIVFFLQGGFAFLEVGSVRSKNATNILIKNLLDVFLGGIAFWLVGYPLAFGEGNGFFGVTHWASHDLSYARYAHWTFQFVFAATAATIVSGSVAERCAFNAYFVYSICLTGFIYPVVAHWAWSGDGWLGATDYHDFAGSGVVHLTGGVAALIGAIMLGPRIGRFDDPSSEIKGHSVPLAGLGGFILLFGFLAFNGGSQGAISTPEDAHIVARSIVNTIMSGSSGAICVLFIYRIRGNNTTWSFLLTLNGALTGMVSICSGCDIHVPWSACLTGFLGGIMYLIFHYAMIKLKIDDPLDAVAVHMGGGMWGLLATPIFTENGLIRGNGEAVKMLIWNLAGMFAIIGWVGGLSLFMFGTLRLLKMLRVPEETERKGLDILKHGEPAYPADAWMEEQYYTRQINPLVRRNSKIPVHMSPPMRPPFDDMSYTQSTFYPPPTQPYWTVPDMRRQYGPPTPRACNLNTLLYPAPNGKGKGRNGKSYSNQAFEMDRL